MSFDLLSKVNDVLKDRVDFLPYNLRDVLVLYGVPPTPIKGLGYVFARHNRSQTRLVMGLSGKGVYLNSKNKSGIIEFATMTGSGTGGIVQLFELTGIPMPIIVQDIASGGTSLATAPSCRRIGTPEWRREKFPGVDIFTFACDNLVISDGVRLRA